MHLTETARTNAIPQLQNSRARKSGLVDFTGTEEEIIAGIRELVSMLPANNEDDMSYEDCTDDLNRVCADLAECRG